MPYKDPKDPRKRESQRRATAAWNARNPDKLRELRRRRVLSGRMKQSVDKYEAKNKAKRALSRPDQRMRRKYGISEREYWRMFEAQDGKCAICLSEPRPTKHSGGQKLHVDHDHRTDRVRDLLCMSCNRALGFLGDNPETVRRAAAYLEGWAATHRAHPEPQQEMKLVELPKEVEHGR